MDLQVGLLTCKFAHYIFIMKVLILMGIVNLLQSFLLNQGAHTQGHMDLAYQMGMHPAYVDYRNLQEVVPRWVSHPRTDDERRRAAAWHAAGFKGQEQLGKQAAETELAQPYELTQGLYNLGYALGVQPSSIEGDVDQLERISGNKATRAFLATSALTKILNSRNPDSRWSLDFIAPQGAPGLKYSVKF